MDSEVPHTETETVKMGSVCPSRCWKMGHVLVGHVNFLLGALVHGVVLRHINLHVQARAMEYAIANVLAIVAGLVAIIAGISTIVLSKNKKRRPLIWLLLGFSILAGLLATAAAVGLTVAMVKAIIYKGKSLLTHCKFPNAIGYSSITNECPFDPTRIYGTTIILWVPLILSCVAELVFSWRCFAVCLSFLHVRSPCHRKRRLINARRVRVRSSPVQAASPPRPQPQEVEATPAEQHELIDRNASTHRTSEWV
ncbi:hypothetical protein AGOR_G00101160 [Albula goreensis]|uniref:Uncharacterized protein n=1 Tax=Albula goreensis TaxID=1534307 RepID=A0A8T3DCI3_9TELE|nr:hypothetical protein AGOR_G00101160 [Albula goreensis]